MKATAAIACAAVALSVASSARADQVTLVAPGGMRCAIDRMTAGFEQKTGHTIAATIGSGGGTHEQIVRGDVFDVSIVQPPYSDVIASGNVVAGSETPLATVPMVVVVKEGSPRPDISSADAVRRMLLAAKAISYPDGAGGRGGAAGVSFDLTQKQLGIFELIQPKVKRVQGVALLTLLTRGDIDVAVTFSSEVNDHGVEVVGQLPKEISTPTALVGFIHARAKAPAAARMLLMYLSSPEAATVYQACGMQAAH